jgi:hypothetical protein
MWASHYSFGVFFMPYPFLPFFLLPAFTDSVTLDPEYWLRCNIRFTIFERGLVSPIWRCGHARPGAPTIWYVVSLGCVFYRVRRVAIVFLRHRRIMRFVSDLESGHSLTVQYRPLGAHIGRNCVSLTHCSLLAFITHLPTHMMNQVPGFLATILNGAQTLSEQITSKALSVPYTIQCLLAGWLWYAVE